MNGLDSLLDIYMSNGLTEREAFAQLKEDALKGREIRTKSQKSSSKMNRVMTYCNKHNQDVPCEKCQNESEKSEECDKKQ